MVNLKKDAYEQENSVVVYDPLKKFCTNCGAEVDAHDNFCSCCGHKIKNSATVDPPTTSSSQTVVVIDREKIKPISPENTSQCRNKWIALLLCFCLGFLGAHKFYDGKIFMGIIYFSLFVVFGLLGSGFVVGILVFIDFISILFRPNPYYIGY